MIRAWGQDLPPSLRRRPEFTPSERIRRVERGERPRIRERSLGRRARPRSLRKSRRTMGRRIRGLESMASRARERRGEAGSGAGARRTFVVIN